MNIYDTLRPGWNAGYTILIGLSATALIATQPAMAQNRPEKAHKADRSPYASQTDTPYSNRSVRREREARRIAKAIREDERRERSRYQAPRLDRYDDEDYDDE